MDIKHRQLLLVIILLAALFRYAALGTRSLWLDEAFSVTRAGLTQTQIWSGKYEPFHPPLFYSALHAWIRVAGDSEFAVRILSAFSSILALAVFYILGRQLFDKSTAMVAVSLLAISPIDIWYAQEARMYAHVVLAGLLFALGLMERHWSGMLLACIALTVGLYLDYTMVPLWVGISALWFVIWLQLSRKGTSLLIWLVSLVCGWGAYQLWLPHLKNMLARLNQVVFFDRVQSLLSLPEFSILHYLTGMAIAGSGIFAVAYVSSKWLHHRKFRQYASLVMILVFVIALILFSIPRFYSIKRILVTGWSFCILLVTWVISRLEKRKYLVWYALFAISLFSSLVTLFTPKDDWRSVVAFFNQSELSGTTVWIDPGWDRIVYDYYGPLKEARYGKLEELQESITTDDIWLIAERYMGQPVPSSDSEVWLDKHLNLEETVSFYRLE